MPTFYVRVSFLQCVLHIPLISTKYGRKKYTEKVMKRMVGLTVA